MNNITQVPIKAVVDIITARSTARQVAARIGFSIADQTRLATSVSELARNVLNYATEGMCTISDVSNDSELSLNITIEDHGPGITNIEAALTDGYSTGGGLGAGLPGIRRLMDELEIESRPGLTRITFTMIRQRF